VAGYASPFYVRVEMVCWLVVVDRRPCEVMILADNAAQTSDL